MNKLASYYIIIILMLNILVGVRMQGIYFGSSEKNKSQPAFV
jgi:hypothetical protein